MKLMKLMLQVLSLALAPSKAPEGDPVMHQECHEIFLAHIYIKKIKKKLKKLESSLPPDFKTIV
jgi:hypothetical protein